MAMRKTAGVLHLEAVSDFTKYDPLEIAEALTGDVHKNLIECAKKHENIFGEKEFFVCLFIASDPLIASLKRFKYAAFLFLPSPRPRQVCFLYTKATQKFRRLWSPPDPKVMATISCMSYVDKRWQQTKGWCDAFYNKNFWEHIRSEHNISHLSETEFLKLHAHEIVKPVDQNVSSDITETFDFSKIATYKVVDPDISLANQ